MLGTNSYFLIPISLKPSEFIHWNIKDLRSEVAKIYGSEYQNSEKNHLCLIFRFYIIFLYPSDDEDRVEILKIVAQQLKDPQRDCKKFDPR